MIRLKKKKTQQKTITAAYLRFNYCNVKILDTVIFNLKAIMSVVN